jgi:hypothetical protein
MEAILAENYAGFDDQDFLELFSQSMWCLRNANRRFGGDAGLGCPPTIRPANLQDDAVSFDE